RSALIVAQVSASFMLLIAAGLTLRSLVTVQRINPGIRTENLVSWRADMSFDKFPLTMSGPERRAKVAAYWTEYEQRLRAIPGVLEVGGGGTFPLNEYRPVPPAAGPRGPSAAARAPAAADRRPLRDVR